MQRIPDQNIVLLLTATVTPQFCYITTSPKVRRKQYVTAIRWYLENTPFRIVIGENSGCETLLDGFGPEFKDRLELICYQETNTTRQFGYNELLILKNVNERSAFLKSAALVFKITGRLIVKNIKWHVAQLRYAGGGGYIAANIHRNLQYIDSRFFCFTPSKMSDILAEEPNCCALFWDDIHAGKCKNGDGGKYVDFESTLGAVIRKGMAKDRHSFRYLLCPIFITGMEGYYGHVYNDSFWFRVKQTIKKIIWNLDYFLVVRPSLNRRING